MPHTEPSNAQHCRAERVVLGVDRGRKAAVQVVGIARVRHQECATAYTPGADDRRRLPVDARAHAGGRLVGAAADDRGWGSSSPGSDEMAVRRIEQITTPVELNCHPRREVAGQTEIGSTNSRHVWRSTGCIERQDIERQSHNGGPAVEDLQPRKSSHE